MHTIDYYMHIQKCVKVAREESVEPQPHFKGQRDICPSWLKFWREIKTIPPILCSVQKVGLGGA